MQKGILGFVKGTFYVENQGKPYNLYLNADIRVDELTREKFVELSTGRRNEAYSGFMGKVRLSVDTMMNNAADDMYVADSLYCIDYEMGGASMLLNPIASYERMWTLSTYRRETQENTVVWDELEKSIVASIADEVLVGARSNYVDIIVVKNFGGKKNEN